MNRKKIVLVAFYNVKALGVRYLETALTGAGYEVSTVYFKGFNSVCPSAATKEELSLLLQKVKEVDPVYVGLSVMSSMYLDSVNGVIDTLKEGQSAPLVAGGAFATLYPEKLMERGVDYVIRSDGEISSCQLADALRDGTEYREIPSLCYKNGGEIVKNDIGNIKENIDEYGLPAIVGHDACYIEGNTLRSGDPQINTMSYEVIASRGCPFTCSYCSSINLHRLFPKSVKYVRTRSVKSVIDELILAKKQLKNLVFVHFYDEIFPDLPGWVDEFTKEYKKHINLPFTIWSHPKHVKSETLKKLVKVGLCEVIMGIQSGSDYIRKEIFHRHETGADIINATKTIRDSGVFWATYDFMLQHPFETADTIKETYALIKDIAKPCELQLHGLNFLPGTDIIKMTIDAGIMTQEEMDKIMFAPMEEQFNAYKKRDADEEIELWYRMSDCLQFADLAKRVEKFEADPLSHKEEINALYEKAQKKAKLRYYYKKSRVVLKSKLRRLGL